MTSLKSPALPEKEKRESPESRGTSSFTRPPRTVSEDLLPEYTASQELLDFLEEEGIEIIKAVPDNPILRSGSEWEAFEKELEGGVLNVTKFHPLSGLAPLSEEEFNVDALKECAEIHIGKINEKHKADNNNFKFLEIVKAVAIQCGTAVHIRYRAEDPHHGEEHFDALVDCRFPQDIEA